MQSLGAFVCVTLGSFALVLASACGDSGGSGGGSSEPGSCSSQAKALCEKTDDCSRPTLQYAYGDLKTCIERVTIDCEADVAAPGSNTTPADLKACASALAKESCEDWAQAGRRPACSVPGSRADGEPCGTDTQCQSTRCAIEPGATCGTCMPLMGEGEPCTDVAACGSGLLCAGGVCMTPQDPAPPLALGEACDPLADQCDRLQLQICYPQTNVCTQIPIAGLGETCGLVNGSDYVSCSLNLTCTGGFSEAGTCVAKAADGESCVSASCVSPAQCINEICAVPDPGECG